MKQTKKLYRVAQKIKHSTSKDTDKKKQRAQEVIDAHAAYCQQAQMLIAKAQVTLASVILKQDINTRKSGKIQVSVNHITTFIAHANRQIDQIERRVIQGEIIPHHEKVFSLFQEHTEWISKGKAGVPVELGLRVCIFEDQMGFILHHQVMQKTTDDQIAVSMVTEAKRRFPTLVSASFDKGFHSPENQTELKKHLEQVIMPKKGRRNKEETAREHSGDFRKEKRQHSAVESGINALEVHGLDKCPDHGIDGFKRYVSLAVLARNIQKLGVGLIERERARAKRRKAA